MKWLTLKLVKKHLRVESDYEDDLLSMYAESAEDTVLNTTGRTLEELIEMGGGEKVPTPIVHASLLLVGVSYQFRTPITPTTLSYVDYSYNTILKPYVRLADKTAES